MLPVTANIINYNPIQTPLVNTTIPGSTVTHMPYDNVAPSFSSPQPDNNARGNSTPSLTEPPPTITLPSDTELPTAPPASAQQGASAANLQATFIAQLLSQDLSPQTQIILVQYEKLIAISNVKYKPSYAFKPPVDPAGSFGRILQTERPTVKKVTPPASEPAHAAPVHTETAPPEVATSEVITPPPAPVAAPENNAAPITLPAPANDNNTPVAANTNIPRQDAVAAYAQSVGRVAAQAVPGTVAELV